MFLAVIEIRGWPQLRRPPVGLRRRTLIVREAEFPPQRDFKVKMRPNVSSRLRFTQITGKKTQRLAEKSCPLTRRGGVFADRYERKTCCVQRSFSLLKYIY